MKAWLGTVVALGVLAVGMILTTSAPWLALLPVLSFGLVMAWVQHTTGSDHYPWGVALGLVANLAAEATGGRFFLATVLLLTVMAVVHTRRMRQERVGARP